jgi:hypothetical protein
MSNRYIYDENGVIFNGYKGHAPMSHEAAASSLNSLNMLCEGYESQIKKLTEEGGTPRESLNLDPAKACKGLNCNSLDESNHSKDCQDEHSKSCGFTGNSHDKLAEENKMLREALNHQYMHNILDWAICGISTNSASGTIGRAERMNKFNEFKIALNKAIGACE